MEIIDNNKGSNVYIKTYNLGKEEILITLADHYKTKIVVSEERYKDILGMKLRPECFTTDTSKSWIFCIKYQVLPEDIRKEDKHSIFIKPTGWANIKKYQFSEGGYYTIPYSSHSNYQELESFVKAICPGKLVCVVMNQGQFSTGRQTNMNQGESYLSSLKNLKQRGYQDQCECYTSAKNFSAEYKKWWEEKNQVWLRQELGIMLSKDEEIKLDTKQFENANKNVFDAKNTNRFGKGVKLMDPFENSNLRVDDMFIIMNQRKQQEQKSNQENFDKKKIEGDIAGGDTDENIGEFAIDYDSEGCNYEDCSENSEIDSKKMNEEKIFGVESLLIQRLKRSQPDNLALSEVEQKDLTNEEKLLMIERDNQTKKIRYNNNDPWNCEILDGNDQQNSTTIFQNSNSQIDLQKDVGKLEKLTLANRADNNNNRSELNAIEEPDSKLGKIDFGIIEKNKQFIGSLKSNKKKKFL